MNTDLDSLMSLASERYLADLEVRNYSPKTIENHRMHLRRLCRYLSEQGIDDPIRVTTGVLRGWQVWLSALPTTHGNGIRGAGTFNRERSTIHCFFAWLVKEGSIGSNPASDLDAAKEPQTLPCDVLTVEEVQHILEQPDTGTVLGYRDRTILEVLYATGIRKGELIALKLQDVRLSDELLTIRKAKGQRDRVVPLGSLACSYLQTYLNAVRSELTSYGDTGHVFLSMRSRMMGKNTPLVLVQKYAAKAGIRKHVTCHLWRHTCATHLVRNKANLRHVQQLLGHGNLSTTERYLHLTIADLKEAHRQCHPRESGDFQ